MMKKNYILGMIMMLMFVVSSAMAQMTPQPSPKAGVSQVVGLTEIKVDYSSPAVKGRKIWGTLVPFDQVWRAGANQPTKISFADEVTVNGTKVPAGTYTLMLIPSKTNWTFIISKDAKNAGAFGYDKAEDVVRITAPVQKAKEAKERLTYMIEANNESTGVVTLAWEKSKASFTVTTDPKTKAMANIQKTIADAKPDAPNTWYIYASAAEYYLDQKVDAAKANEWLDKSISIKAHPYNLYLKAEAMAAQKNYAEAIKFGNQAKEMIDKDGGKDNFFNAMKDPVNKGLTEWSKNAGK